MKAYVIRFLCAISKHRLGQWNAYTWDRTGETLTFAVRSCACAKNTESKPISAESKPELLPGYEWAGITGETGLAIVRSRLH